MNSFRFNASRVFLTYSQTPEKLTPEKLLTAIKAKAGVDRYCISQERHADGGWHLHAFFKFTEKLDTKSSAFFDIKYYRSFHPNIVKVTKEPMLLKYIKKQGESIENFDTRPDWLALLDDCHDDKVQFLTELQYRIGRYDNYSGYRNLRDLYDAREYAYQRGTFKSPLKKAIYKSK